MGKKPVITNNIRRLRFDASEMTQAQLAEAVGVTRQTIVAIEKAKYAPSLELAFMISRAFKKDLNDVFTIDFGDDHDANDDQIEVTE